MRSKVPPDPIHGWPVAFSPAERQWVTARTDQLQKPAHPRVLGARAHRSAATETVSADHRQAGLLELNLPSHR